MIVCFRDAGEHLAETIASVEVQEHERFELILVDDGSTDRTAALIREHMDQRTKLIIFTKNYGQTQAMSAGINEAAGEYIVTMDGDLQNDPTDIPVMLQKIETEEWDLVAGRRKNRKDGALLRKIPSRIANAIILPHAIAFNADVTAPQLIPAAEAMKVPENGSSPQGRVEALGQRIFELIRQMNLPQRLHDVGVQEEDLPRLAQLAFQNRTVQNNPKPITDVTQLENLLRASW